MKMCIPGWWQSWDEKDVSSSPSSICLHFCTGPWGKWCWECYRSSGSSLDCLSGKKCKRNTQVKECTWLYFRTLLDISLIQTPSGFLFLEVLEFLSALLYLEAGWSELLDQRAVGKWLHHEASVWNGLQRSQFLLPASEKLPSLCPPLTVRLEVSLELGLWKAWLIRTLSLEHSGQSTWSCYQAFSSAGRLLCHSVLICLQPFSLDWGR